MIELIVVVLLVLLVLGGLPNWGYHRAGYGPSGALTVVLVIVVLWLLFGHGHFRI